MKYYVIIIIVAVAALALLTFAIVVLICIFRRRRIQRLERERNLSYNNMNYESTVKFRVNENGESGNLGGTSGDDVFSNSNKKKSPAEKGNNNRPSEGYEEVDLPNSSCNKEQKREYENVAPQNSKKEGKSSSPTRPYENVSPIALAPKDNDKAKPGAYEQVVLSSSSKNDETKEKDKRYENVEPPNLSQ